jgi:hypothetical protein
VLTPTIKGKLFKQIKDKTEEFYSDNISHAHNLSGFYSILSRINMEMYKILIGEAPNV